jgi:DNA polymerase III alpha subunit
MGLRSVRLLGEKAYNIIEAERANGPYLDFIDFCIRVGRDGHVNKSIKENLVKAGAFRFDTTMTAKDMVDNVELIQTLVKKYVDKLTKEEIREELMEKIVFTGNEYASQEILNNERSVLSFFISSHPALQYSRLFSLFDGMDFISPAELQEQDDGTTVTMFGIVEQKMLKMTNGDTPKPYLTVKVSDQLASETVRIWSPLSTILNDRIIQDQLILMTGKVKPDAFIAGAKQLQVNGACAIILQGGIPVNSIMADEEYKCNQVVQLIGADVAMTNNQMLNGACAMTFKSNAYIKPDHFETLKKLKNVRYGIAFEMQVFEPRKRNKYAK